MKVCIALYGALRDASSDAELELDVADGCSVADVRDALRAHVKQHAAGISDGLVQRSALATDAVILRDDEAVPADGRLVILPPVGGG